MNFRRIRLPLIGILLTAVILLLVEPWNWSEQSSPKEDIASGLPSPLTVDQALQLATEQQRNGQLSDARRTLERAVSKSPHNAANRRLLIRLLSGVGLRFEALQHLHVLLEDQQTQLSDLLQLANNGRALAGRLQLERAHQLQPDDPLPLIGLLHTALAERDAADFARLLAQASSTFDPPPPQLVRLKLQSELLTSRQLRTNLDADRTDESRAFVTELQQLIQHAPEHPANWLLAAEWARQQNLESLHEACLWQALQQDPWNSSAVSGLASSLAPTSDAIAEQLRQLEQRLQAIDQAAAAITRAPNDLPQFQVIAKELSQIGRHSEALAWARAALTSDADIAWAAQIVTTETLDTAWTHPAFATVRTPPVLSFPQPADVASIETSTATIRLEDVAEQTGLKFAYSNGRRAEDRGLKMHEWTGGGVAVLDFDNDSWPDLYFPQGGTLQLTDGLAKTTESGSSRPLQDASAVNGPENLSDQLFRNGRATAFDAVTEQAGIHETRFGQGVAAGDINHDGFSDLYVANIGTNRVLTNMGDGTFIAKQVRSENAAWTTSVAIADINFDGHPDLYDVNYLAGADVFTRTCDHDGRERICGPTAFSAASDCLLLSDGQGSFAEWKADSEGPHDARGLGIVVADFTGSGRNQIYIANDEGANQLLTPESDQQTQQLQLSDSALAAGIASDHYGQLQGSMGIAVADVDRNGWPDLFVTNYYAEANTLYTQQHPHLFTDVTSARGLAVPGYSQLGFGCQFLDIEADGSADLAVLNGHLDDFTFKGHPWHMRPQLFSNTGNGSFQERVPAGGYFQTATLGRALATLDWNRDGTCDLVATHLDRPTALISNQTPQILPTSRFKLVGIQSARRPVSASVSISHHSSVQRQWLTAGDGYQCSNQPELRLVLAGTEPCVININWPDSTTQNITVTPGSSVTVIQGRTAAWSIPE